MQRNTATKTKAYRVKKQGAAQGVFLLVLYMSLLLPGCCFNLFRSSADQKIIDRAHRSVRSAFAYDQSTTVGFFEVLWLNWPVQQAYDQLFQRRTRNLSDCSTCRTLVPAVDKTTFILLGTYERELFSPYCGWLLFLEVDGAVYANPVVQGVDLPCEYRLFFGSLYNQFKTSYTAEFAIPNSVVERAQSVKLVFRSGLQDMAVCWKQRIKKGKKKYEDSNRCRPPRI